MDDKWKAWLQRAKAYGQNLYRDVQSGLDETSGLPAELQAKGESMRQAREALGQPVDPNAVAPSPAMMQPYAPQQKQMVRPMSGQTTTMRRDSGPGF